MSTIRRLFCAVLAVVLIGATTVTGTASPASAAAAGSIPFTIVEHFDAPRFFDFAPGTKTVACRYFVLAEFDASEAFYRDTPDGPKPYIMVSRPGMAAPAAVRAWESIPGFEYQTGSNLSHPPQVTYHRFPDIVPTAGRLFYVWYGYQDSWDQLNEWNPDGSQCMQVQQFRNTGQAPTNARNLLGLYPEAAPVKVTLRTGLERNVEVGEDVPISMTVQNTSSSVLEDLALPGTGGLDFSTDHIELVSGPDPAPPTSLAPGASITLDYVVRPIATGNHQIGGTVDGVIDGERVSERDTVIINVPPDLKIALTTTATAGTKVDDQFDVVATITNDDPEEITGIKLEPLSPRPGSVVSKVAGPLAADGSDAQANPFSLEPGASTTVTWTMKVEEKGTVDLTALLSGRDPREGSLFFLSEAIQLAFEAPGLAITDLRLQPGAIVPGQFGHVRGTITNTGSTDVIGVDFTLESNPELVVVDALLDKLDPAISPRIDSMEPEESRDFMIPVQMVMDAGDMASYRVDLKMEGTSLIESESVPVETVATTGNALDLTPYWSTIIGDVKRNLLSDTLDFFEGVNSWGDKSTLGGVAVGSSQGALTAFKKMGDGILTTNDFIAEEVGSGGIRLSETGKAVVAASREYLHTHTAKELAADLKGLGYDVGVGGAKVMGDWLRDIDRAASEGKVREVSRLLSEPATTVALGVGVEQAGGQLFAKLVSSGTSRKVASYLKRSQKPAADTLPEGTLYYARETEDLKDMPTGVPVTGATVARAGLTADEHGWMIEIAKEHGVAFFVRPRPETAARFAKLGYNAKPMPIKLKSVNEIDAKWLGWDDMADSQGLVVFRKPKDPLAAMQQAVADGTLEWGGKEIDNIIARYNHRYAEWKSFEKPFGDGGPTVDPTEGILHKLNGDTLAPDGSIVQGNGFNIQRYGKTVKTRATIDADGVIRFTHNNKPVYSDIDLLAIAKPDGTAIPKEVHQEIARRAGFGIDSQHGDSALTSDFQNWEQAKKFAVQYTNEHKRGGDPLVIVQPDVTTMGYVDSVTVPEGNIPGSDYDLYGVIQTTYEGAGRL